MVIPKKFSLWFLSSGIFKPKTIAGLAGSVQGNFNPIGEMLIQLIGECNVTDEKKTREYCIIVFQSGWIAVCDNLAGQGLIDRSEPLQFKAVCLAIGSLDQIIHGNDGRNNMIRQLQ